MSEKISDKHRQRLAVVYIRQSSPGQVKNHPESYRVQKRLAQRAIELGWRNDKVQIIEGDLGTSAATPGSRQDFENLIHLVQDQQVGIVFGSDVSRLARNNIDWSLLTHWCAMHGVLLGDQTQVFDPTLPQDCLLLGIQGALAVHELHAIQDRMRRGLEEKASRGELHHGVPRGYVVVDGKHLKKHPDMRVQRAIVRVFEKFNSCKSVSQLVSWLWANEFQLPRSAGGDGLQVRWGEANYRCVLNMLQNPKYAGIYVHPRYLTETKTSPSGTVKKLVRLADVDEWRVVLHDRHPSYITAERYHANRQKIAMNAQRYANRSGGAPHSGSSLLSGLITCRRCHHKMQVRYGRLGQVSYSCRNGRRQRDKGQQSGDAQPADTRGCFRFAAEELERQLSEQILWAVSPAGIAAAELAAQRMEATRDQRRQQLSDESEHLRYEADLTRRRFDKVDPDNRLVFDTLACELEAALGAAEQQALKLAAFDREEPACPTASQRARLQELGGCLEKVWYDPQTDGSLKKQMVRLLIEHVYAELDEESDEVILCLKWLGGHHTSLRATCRRGRKVTMSELPTIIDTLRKLCDDESIARVLNRSGITSKGGKSWTKTHVGQYRKRHQIAAFSRSVKESSGWLSQQETATYLGISPMSVNRLIERGTLPAEGTSPLPRVIGRNDLASEVVQVAVRHIKSHGNAPLPKNPNQLTLFF